MKILSMEEEYKADVREAHEKALQYFLSPGAIKESTHVFKVGLPERYYFDFDVITVDPEQAKDVLELLKNSINDIKYRKIVHALAFIEKAAGGTTGALRFAAALSIDTKLPSITVRMSKEIDFEKVKFPLVEGMDVKKRLNGLNIILVTDHCTTGGEALVAADIISKNGGTLTDVVTYTVRLDMLDESELTKRDIDFYYI